MESLFLHADSPQRCGLGVSTLSVHLPRRFLHVLLRLIPVLHPAPVELRRGPVAFGRTAHGAVALGDVARLFGQLILVDEATLLVAGFFGVSPRLFLPGCKEAIKHDAPIMHEGSNEEDVLPLFSGLQTEKRLSHSLIFFCLTRSSATVHVLVIALLLVQSLHELLEGSAVWRTAHYPKNKLPLFQRKASLQLVEPSTHGNLKASWVCFLHSGCLPHPDWLHLLPVNLPFFSVHFLVFPNMPV